MDAGDKLRRHREILALIKGPRERGVRHEPGIGSQEDLRQSLRARGYNATQATLSRDLKELRIVRVPDGARYRYAVAVEAPGSGSEPAAGKQRLGAVAALEVIGIDANEVGVLVRTLIGRAPGVAVYIDGLANPEILGTLAGDDTILVLPRSVKRTARLKAELEEALGLGQPRRASSRAGERWAGQKPPARRAGAR